VQWAAIALAGAGIAVQLVKVGRVPWIALVLAVSFAFYGLLRKRGPLGPLTGLGVETTLLAPAALVLLVARGLAGTGALGRVDFEQHVLILATGVVTAIPLLLFAIGARALPLTTLGLLQYMSPTVQLGLGVLVYHEVFDATLATSFGLIWAGLALYSADGVMRRRTAFRSAGDEPHPKAR
jgi:chloramphenicol-sensitive protein RarD